MADPIVHTDTTGTALVTPTGTGLKVKDGGISLNNSAPVAGQLTGATVVSPTITGATLTTATLTSPIINTPTIKDLTEVVAATNVIAASETGSVFFLNHATEFVSTLPTLAAGLHFTFIISGAPSGANYTVVAASGTPILGHLLCSQDAGGTADSETSGCLTVTFVASKSVVGDMAEFWCDGTNWFCTAKSKVFDAITFS